MALHNEKKLLYPQSIALLDAAVLLRRAVCQKEYAKVHELAHGAGVVANGLLKMSKAILEDDGSKCEYCSVEHLSK